MTEQDLSLYHFDFGTNWTLTFTSIQIFDRLCARTCTNVTKIGGGGGGGAEERERENCSQFFQGGKVLRIQK